MKLTRTSPLTGITIERELPISERLYEMWQRKEILIQDAMPNVRPEDREWVMTGYTQEDWDTIFPPEEE